MPTITLRELIETMGDNIEKIESGKSLGIAVVSVTAEMGTRIFAKGLDSNADKIGNYNSTNPIYVNPNKSPKKFATKGKTGETTFENGKKHKTGFFKSYKDFRGAIGRENSFVNIDLSGDLKSDFNSSVQRVSNTKYEQVLKRNGGKSLGLEKKYGDIFALTTEENLQFLEILADPRNA